MAILAHDGNHVVFKHGKHRGETLDEVAESDPGYLKWVFHEASGDLSDDIFRVLEDCLTDHDIDV